MDFVSSITLQFKDMFSSGFQSAASSLGGLESSLKGLGGVKLDGIVTPQMSPVEKGLADINSGMEKIAENNAFNIAAGQLSQMAGSLSQFAAKLGAIMDEPSRLAATFDSSLRNIQSLMGDVSDGQMSEIKNKLLDIGSSAVEGPNAVAEAFYNITSGIGNAEVRFDALQAAVALAESGQADLASATSGLISVVNAYNTPAENMSGLSDVFFQTVKKGVGSLGGFVGAMSSISGLSASVGIGFDELGSSMAFLTAKGQTESVAATQLKAAMVSLMRPNETLSKALESVGIKSGSAMLEQYGLAESMAIVKQAVGGSQDQMAKALGSVEALQAAITLTGDDYAAFAGSFSASLSGAAAQGLEAQALSYEARLAKLTAAQDTLKIQMGDDINAIKGFFVDMGSTFLERVALPIMSSPIGGVFQRVAAGVGLAAQGVVQFGGGALNTASQIFSLAVAVKNLGGFSQIFSGALGVMRGGVLKIIPTLATFGAALWTALAPVLPFVAAGVALGAAIYLLVKNFDKVRGFLAGIPDGVLAAVSAFLPFIGIPALVIKHWDTIKAFFVGLWVQVSAGFTQVWSGLLSFFAGVWQGIVGVVAGVANWFSAVWAAVSGAFCAAWTFARDIFAGVWESIKTVVLGFVEWLSPVIDMIIAPFKAIGNAIGAIFNTVGGWFGKTVEMGQATLDGAAAANAAAAKPVETGTSLDVPALSTPAIAAPAIAVSAPAFEGGLSAPGLAGTSTTTGGAGKNALVMEHLAAAARKGVETGEGDFAASDAFSRAGLSTDGLASLDSALEAARTASSITVPDTGAAGGPDFSAALRPERTVVTRAPWTENTARSEKPAARKIVIQNLQLCADDMKSALDFVRELEAALHEPVEAAA